MQSSTKHPLAAEASDSTTAPERLAALSHDHTLKALIASNHATPATILETLSNEKDPVIRRAVTENPNTPVAILLHLAQEFPHTFLANPILPFLNLAQPDCMQDASPQTWLHLLRCEHIPPMWLQWLQETPVPPYDRVRGQVKATARLHIALAGAPVGQREIYTAMAGEHTQLLHRIALHPYTPVELLAWLATSPEARRTVVCNPRVPPALLHQLAGDIDMLVRYAVAGNQRTPPADLEALAHDSRPIVRASVASNRQLPAGLYQLLRDDRRPSVLAALGGNIQAPAEVLAALADDLDPQVRSAAAGNPGLPVALFPALLDDTAGEVRINLAKNPQLPFALFQRLAKEPVRKIRRNLAANPRTPLPVLEQLMQGNHTYLWEQVARNPQTTPELLVQLATKGNARVWAGVAAHKHTPVEVLYRLANQSRRALARGEQHFWKGIISNPHAPPDLLEAAFIHARIELRFGLVCHPAISSEQRQVMVERLVEHLVAAPLDRCPRQWSHVLIRPDLPLPVLRAFAQSVYWEERCLLALHPELPRTVLDELAQDGNRYVRTVAREALKQHAAP